VAAAKCLTFRSPWNRSILVASSGGTAIEEYNQTGMSRSVVDEVDDLSEEVKDLALNLALYLAKIKQQADTATFVRLEPDFIRLVHGAVRVVKDVTVILNAARNRERMVYEVPSGKPSMDQLELKLHGILEQCHRVLAALSEIDH